MIFLKSYKYCQQKGQFYIKSKKEDEGMKEITTKSGQKFTFLSRREKFDKYSKELETGIKYSNDMTPRLTKKGNQIRLTESEASWRGGYLSSYRDSARIFYGKDKNKEE